MASSLATDQPPTKLVRECDRRDWSKLADDVFETIR